MLKKFEVANYKNFKDNLILDFSKVGGYQFSTDCISNDKIAKMLIYGKNGAGKSNLGRAICDIMDIRFGNYGNDTVAFLNADSQETTARFCYSFQFDEDEVIYTYLKASNAILVYEELVINGSIAFSNDFLKAETLIVDLALLGADTIVVDRYYEDVNNQEINDEDRETLPFLRWLITNTALKEESILLRLNDYIGRMNQVVITSDNALSRMRGRYNTFYGILENKEELRRFETFMNEMGVECKLEIQKLPEGNNELYFVHERPIPFLRTASSGTLSLMRLYMSFYKKKSPSFIYIDEFDAFYHHEMSEKLVRYFKEHYPQCQVIMTTHNTNLMTNSLMRPDCLFILSTKGKLVPLCDATPRELREGHNLEKLYVNGEFDVQ